MRRSCTRFLTYDVKLDPNCAAYCKTIMAMPLHAGMDRGGQGRAGRDGRARRRVLSRREVLARRGPDGCEFARAGSACHFHGVELNRARRIAELFAAALVPKSARPVSNSSTDRVGAIYRALRHAIIEQALEPGAKLPEDAIGERFGASRTIVRHALGQLAAEGLVELRRNRGAAVATPSWDEARDIFDVRLGLERLVVVAARRPADARADRPARSPCRRRGARRAAPTSRCRSGSPTEFHIVLAEMTGKPGA